MLGRDQHLFGSTYFLKVKFENVQGLMVGNNVRISGIEAGTVKRIQILNDTTIEVTMVIDLKMKNIIPIITMTTAEPLPLRISVVKRNVKHARNTSGYINLATISKTGILKTANQANPAISSKNARSINKAMANLIRYTL